MSGSMFPSSQKRAPISLSVIVVGGGLSGLATAYALRRAGHEVLVLEKSDGTARSPAGLRSSPNMTKVLAKWGLKDEFEKHALILGNTNFLEVHTGTMIGVARPDLVDEIRNDSEPLASGDFLFVKHGDTHDLLYQAATREGVSFRFNAQVVQANPMSGSIVIDGGEQLSADLVVAADGNHSILRPYVEHTEGTLTPQAEEAMMLLSFVVPEEDMKDDEELSKMLEKPEWDVWLGEETLVSGHSYLADGRKNYTLLLTYPYQGMGVPDEYQDWKSIDDVSNLGMDVSTSTFEPRVKRLVGMAKHTWGRIFVPKSCPSSLDTSRLVLVGEAAHAIGPNGFVASAMAFEDAYILGCLFSMIENKSQVTRILTAYEEIRLPRASWAQIQDEKHNAFFKAPLVVLREMLNTHLSRELQDGLSDEDIVQLFGDDIKMYAYDPAVETAAWWSQYGSMVVGTVTHRKSIVQIQLEVAEKIASH